MTDEELQRIKKFLDLTHCEWQPSLDLLVSQIFKIQKVNSMRVRLGLPIVTVGYITRDDYSAPILLYPNGTTTVFCPSLYPIWAKHQAKILATGTPILSAVKVSSIHTMYRPYSATIESHILLWTLPPLPTFAANLIEACTEKLGTDYVNTLLFTSSLRARTSGDLWVHHLKTDTTETLIPYMPQDVIYCGYALGGNGNEARSYLSMAYKTSINYVE